MIGHTSFKLEEAMSGEEAPCFWVTLGFVSEEEPHDVLHVVVSKVVKEQDRSLGHDTVYLERYDQGLSCYGGASALRVSGDTIQVELDVKGQESLGFAGPVTFTACHEAKGFDEALATLKKMSELQCGRIISVEGV